MPRCVACNILLPSSVFSDDPIKKCVFCVRGQEVFEDGNIDEGFQIYDKKKMATEYQMYLIKLSNKPNIAELIIKCDKAQRERENGQL